jgi:hypothetical protein
MEYGATAIQCQKSVLCDQSNPKKGEEDIPNRPRYCVYYGHHWNVLLDSAQTQFSLLYA